MKRLALALALLLAGCLRAPAVPTQPEVAATAARPSTATVRAATAEPTATATATAEPEVDLRVYLVLGVDWQEGRNTWNTDTVILVIVNPEGQYVSLVSIPRDLLVELPGGGEQRLSSVLALHGIGALQEVLESFSGLSVDGYMLISLTGFRRAIDRLGGLVVTPAESLATRCNHRDFVLAAGRAYRLDGSEALCYARDRSSSSDFARMGRQQELLVSVGAAFLRDRPLWEQPALIVDLWNLYSRHVETDIRVLEAVDLIPWAMREGGLAIHRFRIIPPLVERVDSPTLGMWLLRADAQGLADLMARAVEGRPGE